jgi:hypothetical protein
MNSQTTGTDKALSDKGLPECAEKMDRTPVTPQAAVALVQILNLNH